MNGNEKWQGGCYAVGAQGIEEFDPMSDWTDEEIAEYNDHLDRLREREIEDEQEFTAWLEQEMFGA